MPHPHPSAPAAAVVLTASSPRAATPERRAAPAPFQELFEVGHCGTDIERLVWRDPRGLVSAASDDHRRGFRTR